MEWFEIDHLARIEPRSPAETEPSISLPRNTLQRASEQAYGMRTNRQCRVRVARPGQGRASNRSKEVAGLSTSGKEAVCVGP
jgi:hypothetical protein